MDNRHQQRTPLNVAPGAPSSRALILPILALVLFKVILTWWNPLPLFTADSESYLHTAKRWWISPIRPAGTGLFYRIVALVYDDIRSLVVAQRVLGLATAAAVYFIARQLLLPGSFALASALLVGFAPSTNLFEQTIHSETLAAFLVCSFILSTLWARASDTPSWWALCGLVAAAGALVRTVLTQFVVLAPFLAWRDARTARPARVLAAAATALVPLAVYGLVSQVAFGAYGVTFFDGASTFALVARGIDCSQPTRPPTIRSELCHDPELLKAEPWTILWDPRSPVQASVRASGWPATNRQLRTLAAESILRAPDAALLSVGHRVVESLATEDPPYAAHPAETALPFNVATDFPQNVDEYERGGELWNAALSLWYQARLALFGVAALASVLCWSRIAGLYDRDVQTLSLVSWGIYAGTICTTYVTPRLMFPLEAPAVLLSAWLLYRWRAAYLRGARA